MERVTALVESLTRMVINLTHCYEVQSCEKITKNLKMESRFF